MILVNEWIKESRENRTKHLDLSSDCLFRGGCSTQHRGVLAQYLDTDIPKGFDLCHACHNGLCSNPKHLYWGTRKENNQDAIDNGRPTIWQRTVYKYGLEEAKLRQKHASPNGGKAGKGKQKTESHRQKISEALKNKHKAVVGE